MLSPGRADEIINEIERLLRPLKPKIRDVARKISERIFCHDPETKQRLDPPRPLPINVDLASSSRDRKRAKDAYRALAVLERYAERLGVSADEYLRVRTALGKLADAGGPDRRTKPETSVCAQRASVLVSELSVKRPSTAENGNVHSIARLVYEATTGKVPSDVALLQAVRKVVRPKKEPRSARLTLTTTVPIIKID
jgi:hypothetical protein